MQSKRLKHAEAINCENEIFSNISICSVLKEAEHLKVL